MTRQPADVRARTATALLMAPLLLLAVLAVSLLAPAPAHAGRKQWAVFEDHTALVRSSPSKRARTLSEIRRLGADTLRVEVRWNEVAPRPRSRHKPTFDDRNPAAYPGFWPYDNLITQATALGMRVIITLTGDTPRWATAGGRGRSFAAAVAKRYSGHFGLPAVRYFTIWNEPNHKQFLKPQRSAPALYRNLVDAAIPQVRSNGASHVRVFVGETAPVGRPGKATGPKAFIRRWLCLSRRLRATRHGSGCRHFKRIKADGFAHHPYGPVDRVPRKLDVINMLNIRTLGQYLDRAAGAHRLPGHLPIYSTEFGLQSNPPDFSVSTTPSKQARLINEKELYSYKYSRLKSYSQYLLHDDPARPGPASLRWAGFQTGLRFPSGRRKPSWNAYRFPIVVHRRRGGVSVWGCVRPGEGGRYARLYAGGRRAGPLVRTNSMGYFQVRRKRVANYRFRAYDRSKSGALHKLGTSRTAAPTR
jgi:Cellulase (glycosyl hydrolase family 5)